MLTNEEPCENLEDHILQKTKKMELIPYATNNEEKSKENERKTKQKQWRNCKE